MASAEDWDLEFGFDGGPRPDVGARAFPFNWTQLNAASAALGDDDDESDYNDSDSVPNAPADNVTAAAYSEVGVSNHVGHASNPLLVKIVTGDRRYYTKLESTLLDAVESVVKGGINTIPDPVLLTASLPRAPETIVKTGRQSKVCTLPQLLLSTSSPAAPSWTDPAGFCTFLQSLPQSNTERTRCGAQCTTVQLMPIMHKLIEDESGCGPGQSHDPAVTAPDRMLLRLLSPLRAGVMAAQLEISSEGREDSLAALVTSVLLPLPEGAYVDSVAMHVGLCCIKAAVSAMNAVLYDCHEHTPPAATSARGGMPWPQGSPAWCAGHYAASWSLRRAGYKVQAVSVAASFFTGLVEASAASAGAMALTAWAAEAGLAHLATCARLACAPVSGAQRHGGAGQSEQAKKQAAAEGSLALQASSVFDAGCTVLVALSLLPSYALRWSARQEGAEAGAVKRQTEEMEALKARLEAHACIFTRVAALTLDAVSHARMLWPHVYVPEHIKSQQPRSTTPPQRGTASDRRDSGDITHARIGWTLPTCLWLNPLVSAAYGAFNGYHGGERPSVSGLEISARCLVAWKALLGVRSSTAHAMARQGDPKHSDTGPPMASACALAHACAQSDTRALHWGALAALTSLQLQTEGLSPLTLVTVSEDSGAGSCCLNWCDKPQVQVQEGGRRGATAHRHVSAFTPNSVPVFSPTGESGMRPPPPPRAFIGQGVALASIEARVESGRGPWLLQAFNSLMNAQALHHQQCTVQVQGGPPQSMHAFYSPTHPPTATAASLTVPLEEDAVGASQEQEFEAGSSRRADGGMSTMHSRTTSVQDADVDADTSVEAAHGRYSSTVYHAEHVVGRPLSTASTGDATGGEEQRNAQIHAQTVHVELPREYNAADIAGSSREALALRAQCFRALLVRCSPNMLSRPQPNGAETTAVDLGSSMQLIACSLSADHVSSARSLLALAGLAAQVADVTPRPQHGTGPSARSSTDGATASARYTTTGWPTPPAGTVSQSVSHGRRLSFSNMISSSPAVGSLPTEHAQSVTGAHVGVAKAAPLQLLSREPARCAAASADKKAGLHSVTPSGLRSTFNVHNVEESALVEALRLLNSVPAHSLRVSAPVAWGENAPAGTAAGGGGQGQLVHSHPMPALVSRTGAIVLSALISHYSRRSGRSVYGLLSQEVSVRVHSARADAGQALAAMCTGEVPQPLLDRVSSHLCRVWQGVLRLGSGCARTGLLQRAAWYRERSLALALADGKLREGFMLADALAAIRIELGQVSAARAVLACMLYHARDGEGTGTGAVSAEGREGSAVSGRPASAATDLLGMTALKAAEIEASRQVSGVRSRQRDERATAAANRASKDVAVLPSLAGPLQCDEVQALPLIPAGVADPACMPSALPVVTSGQVWAAPAMVTQRLILPTVVRQTVPFSPSAAQAVGVVGVGPQGTTTSMVDAAGHKRHKSSLDLAVTLPASVLRTGLNLGWNVGGNVVRLPRLVVLRAATGVSMLSRRAVRRLRAEAERRKNAGLPALTVANWADDAPIEGEDDSCDRNTRDSVGGGQTRWSRSDSAASSSALDKVEAWSSVDSKDNVPASRKRDSRLKTDGVNMGVGSSARSVSYRYMSLRSEDVERIQDWSEGKTEYVRDSLEVENAKDAGDADLETSALLNEVDTDSGTVNERTFRGAPLPADSAPAHAGVVTVGTQRGRGSRVSWAGTTQRAGCDSKPPLHMRSTTSRDSAPHSLDPAPASSSAVHHIEMAAEETKDKDRTKRLLPYGWKYSREARSTISGLMSALRTSSASQPRSPIHHAASPNDMEGRGSDPRLAMSLTTQSNATQDLWEGQHELGCGYGHGVVSFGLPSWLQSLSHLATLLDPPLLEQVAVSRFTRHLLPCDAWQASPYAVASRTRLQCWLVPGAIPYSKPRVPLTLFTSFQPSAGPIVVKRQSQGGKVDPAVLSTMQFRLANLEIAVGAPSQALALLLPTLPLQPSLQALLADLAHKSSHGRVGGMLLTPFWKPSDSGQALDDVVTRAANGLLADPMHYSVQEAARNGVKPARHGATSIFLLEDMQTRVQPSPAEALTAGSFSDVCGFAVAGPGPRMARSSLSGTPFGGGSNLSSSALSRARRMQVPRSMHEKHAYSDRSYGDIASEGMLGGMRLVSAPPVPTGTRLAPAAQDRVLQAMVATARAYYRAREWGDAAVCMNAVLPVLPLFSFQVDYKVNTQPWVGDERIAMRAPALLPPAALNAALSSAFPVCPGGVPTLQDPAALTWVRPTSASGAMAAIVASRMHNASREKRVRTEECQHGDGAAGVQPALMTQGGTVPLLWRALCPIRLPDGRVVTTVVEPRVNALALRMAVLWVKNALWAGHAASALHSVNFLISALQSVAVVPLWYSSCLTLRAGAPSSGEGLGMGVRHALYPYRTALTQLIMLRGRTLAALLASHPASSVSENVTLPVSQAGAFDNACIYLAVTTRDMNARQNEQDQPNQQTALPLPLSAHMALQCVGSAAALQRVGVRGCTVLGGVFDGAAGLEAASVEAFQECYGYATGDAFAGVAASIAGSSAESAGSRAASCGQGIGTEPEGARTDAPKGTGGGVGTGFSMDIARDIYTILKAALHASEVQLDWRISLQDVWFEERWASPLPHACMQAKGRGAGAGEDSNEDVGKTEVEDGDDDSLPPHPDRLHRPITVALTLAASFAHPVLLIRAHIAASLACVVRVGDALSRVTEGGDVAPHASMKVWGEGLAHWEEANGVYRALFCPPNACGVPLIRGGDAQTAGRLLCILHRLVMTAALLDIAKRAVLGDSTLTGASESLLSTHWRLLDDLVRGQSDDWTVATGGYGPGPASRRMPPPVAVVGVRAGRAAMSASLPPSTAAGVSPWSPVYPKRWMNSGHTRCASMPQVHAGHAHGMGTGGIGGGIGACTCDNDAIGDGVLSLHLAHADGMRYEGLPPPRGAARQGRGVLQKMLSAHAHACACASALSKEHAVEGALEQAAAGLALATQLMRAAVATPAPAPVPVKEQGHPRLGSDAVPATGTGAAVMARVEAAVTASTVPPPSTPAAQASGPGHNRRSQVTGLSTATDASPLSAPSPSRPSPHGEWEGEEAWDDVHVEDDKSEKCEEGEGKVCKTHRGEKATITSWETVAQAVAATPIPLRRRKGKGGCSSMTHSCARSSLRRARNGVRLRFAGCPALPFLVDSSPAAPLDNGGDLDNANAEQGDHDDEGAGADEAASVLTAIGVLRFIRQNCKRRVYGQETSDVTRARNIAACARLSAHGIDHNSGGLSYEETLTACASIACGQPLEGTDDILHSLTPLEVKTLRSEASAAVIRLQRLLYTCVIGLGTGYGSGGGPSVPVCMNLCLFTGGVRLKQLRPYPSQLHSDDACAHQDQASHRVRTPHVFPAGLRRFIAKDMCGVVAGPEYGEVTPPDAANTGTSSYQAEDDASPMRLLRDVVLGKPQQVLAGLIQCLHLAGLPAGVHLSVESALAAEEARLTVRAYGAALPLPLQRVDAWMSGRKNGSVTEQAQPPPAAHFGDPSNAPVHVITLVASPSLQLLPWERMFVSAGSDLHLATLPREARAAAHNRLPAALASIRAAHPVRTMHDLLVDAALLCASWGSIDRAELGQQQVTGQSVFWWERNRERRGSVLELVRGGDRAEERRLLLLAEPFPGLSMETAEAALLSLLQPTLPLCRARTGIGGWEACVTVERDRCTTMLLPVAKRDMDTRHAVSRLPLPYSLPASLSTTQSIMAVPSHGEPGVVTLPVAGLACLGGLRGARELSWAEEARVRGILAHALRALDSGLPRTPLPTAAALDSPVLTALLGIAVPLLPPVPTQFLRPVGNCDPVLGILALRACGEGVAGDGDGFLHVPPLPLPTSLSPVTHAEGNGIATTTSTVPSPALLESDEDSRGVTPEVTLDSSGNDDEEGSIATPGAVLLFAALTTGLAETGPGRANDIAVAHPLQTSLQSAMLALPVQVHVKVPAQAPAGYFAAPRFLCPDDWPLRHLLHSGHAPLAALPGAPAHAIPVPVREGLGRWAVDACKARLSLGRKHGEQGTEACGEGRRSLAEHLLGATDAHAVSVAAIVERGAMTSSEVPLRLCLAQPDALCARGCARGVGRGTLLMSPAESMWT